VVLEALATIDHSNCGVRGQDLCLVVTNYTTASLRVVHPFGQLSHLQPGFSTELFPL